MRVFVTLKVAIIRGVRVDEDAGGLMLLGEVDLDATKIHAIARQHDFACHADVQFVEFFEILWPPVIHINHIGSDIAAR